MWLHGNVFSRSSRLVLNPFVNFNLQVTGYAEVLNLIRRIVNSKNLSWLNNVLWIPLRSYIYRARIRSVLRRGKIPVLVYQMGKVASKTIIATLDQYPALHAFHAHLLSPANMARRRPEKEKIKGKDAASLSFHVWRAINDAIIVQSDIPVKIVTLVREPIGRNISAFFQGLDKRVRVPQAHINVPVGQLVERFLQDYPHSRPLTWYDDELLAVTGIDVFSHPFPRDLGYQRIQDGRFDVLIMRHDLPDTLKAMSLGEFLGIPELSIVRDNLSENKTYHACYREFQKTIRLSPEYVNEMLDSKYARHFFPDEEREILRRKWLRLDDKRAGE